MRLTAFILSFSITIFLACVASERKVEQPPPPERIDTSATEYVVDDGDLDASAQPNVHPATAEDVRRAEELERMAHASSKWWRVDQKNATIATDTAQPLRKAEKRTAHFDRAALPPILDERVRECIAYTLTTGFTKARYNLLLQPNLYDVTIRNWSDSKWLATFRVEGGTFPVNLWRIRGGVATYWKQARVQAGPGLPIGNPQETLSAEFFRGGDKLCVEASRSCGPLLIAYDQQTGLVVQPQLSMIQNSSNDSTPVPGAWTKIGGVKENR